MGFENIKYKSFSQALEIKKELSAHYTLENIITTQFNDKPYINFTTSTYLQAAKK